MQEPPELPAPERIDTDTAGDGIPDPVVEFYGENPQRKTIFLEVTAIDGAAVDIDRLKNYFATVDVDNPDGSTGVTVHVEQKDVDRSPDVDVGGYHFPRGSAPSFEREWKGFHHLIVAPEDEHETTLGPETEFFVSCVDGETERALRGLVSRLTETSRWNDPAEVSWTGDQIRTHAPSTYWWEQLAGEPPIHSADDRAGDGIPDEQIETEPLYGDADPGQRNLFLELIPDETVTMEFVTDRARELQELFSRAPLQNPDGSMGVTVHYLVREPVDTLVPAAAQNLADGFYPFYLYTSFKRDSYGDRPRSYPAFSTVNNLPGTLCHELGHRLGILRRDISDEIDNNDGASAVEYPSIMNYSFPQYPRFCADEGADRAPNDWAVIEERMHEDQESILALES